MMVLELFGGLIYLLLAGDLLVRGAVAMAKRAEIPPVVVGLTVVAFGTSAPELFVSLGAAFSGHPGIAIGNVVGSNIANVLLVLGLPALIYPTVNEGVDLREDGAVLMGASLFFVALCARGSLGTLEGVLLFALLLAILWRTVRGGRSSEGVEAAADEELERVLGLPGRGRMIALFLVLGGIGLPLGAYLLVDGAVQIATTFGVSNEVIGLSVVALGTSLPELATTLVAALHRHSDVALGNVVGSNLFNLLAIVGITASVAPAPMPILATLLHFDMPLMLGCTGVLTWIAWRSSSVGRLTGGVFLAGYLVYIWALFQRTAAPA